MAKSLNLIDKVYGRLHVLERTVIDKWGNYKWICLCTCGNKIVVSGGKLKSGTTKSCGCLRKDMMSTLGKNHRITDGESSRNACYGGYIDAARDRNLFFALSKEEFIIITMQRCYYCNKEPSNIKKSGSFSKEYIYSGIDRIDNSKGYTLDNCVPCCKDCNLSKRSRTKTEFIQWIEQTYMHLKEIGEV